MDAQRVGSSMLADVSRRAVLKTAIFGFAVTTLEPVEGSGWLLDWSE
jgi:hypothetical protein